MSSTTYDSRTPEELGELAARAAAAGLGGDQALTIDYVNTIGVAEEPEFPGPDHPGAGHRCSSRARDVSGLTMTHCVPNQHVGVK